MECSMRISTQFYSQLQNELTQHKIKRFLKNFVQILVIQCILIIRWCVQQNNSNSQYCYQFHKTTENIQMAGRDISCCKLINPHFAGVVIFMCFNYFVFVYGYMIQDKPALQVIGIAAFHVLFSMLLWSMGAAILSDPGRVPIYWGFFAEESDNKKRRYCLLCHSFKPQRCHHCSTCQRCVLNMDHHCPWISNCVGYNNRKYFMLFLFYIILTLIFCLAFQIPMLLKEYILITERQQNFNVFTALRTVGFLIQFTFFIVISTFFKFHVDLVLSNSSTLDNLERQRNQNMGPNVYNIGAYENFQQVFGQKMWLWAFPIHSNVGDGVTWRRNQLTA